MWKNGKTHAYTKFHFSRSLCMILFNTWNSYCLLNELIAYLARARQKHQHRHNSISSSRCRSGISSSSSSNKQISSDLNFSPGHLVSRHFQRPLMIACAIRPFHNKFDWVFFSFRLKWNERNKRNMNSKTFWKWVTTFPKEIRNGKRKVTHKKRAD